jgi:hypothetical protein
MSIEDPSPINTSSAREETKGTETCPFPKCSVRCGRPQELERHIRQHLPYYIYCAQQDCNWTGNRRYALRIHLAGKHLGAPIPEPEVFMIYDAKWLVKQLLNKETNVEQATCEARSLFEEKAVQLGKLGIWRWMKGRKITCVPKSLGV